MLASALPSGKALALHERPSGTAVQSAQSGVQAIRLKEQAASIAESILSPGSAL